MDSKLTRLLGEGDWQHLASRAKSTQGNTHTARMDSPTMMEYVVISCFITAVISVSLLSMVLRRKETHSDVVWWMGGGGRLTVTIPLCV